MTSRTALVTVTVLLASIAVTGLLVGQHSAPADGRATSDVDVEPERDTLPDGVFAIWEWDFPDREAMLDAGLIPTTYGPDNGISQPVVLDEPGPWGTVHALRNTFYPLARTKQPQVGMRRDFGDHLPHIWLRTWVRFSPNWTVQPTFRWPDNPETPEDESQIETGNTDHKTLFVFAMDPAGGPWDDWDRRWDIKFGPNGDDCVASGGQHGIQDESYYEAGYFPALGRQDGLEVPPGYVKCRASELVWDGEWHEIAAYMETHPEPTLKVWLDGRLMVNSELARYPMRARPEHRFWSIWFGGNRNSGPAEEMWFEYGAAHIYTDAPADWPAG